MSVKFLRRYYIDPFEVEPITRVEIVEVEDIYYFSKRQKRENIPNYEVRYSVITGSVMTANLREKLKEWQLNIFEYMQLLSEKPQEIQAKFNYNKTEVKTASFYFFMEDRAIENDITCTRLMHEIFLELGIPHTYENDNIIRSLVEDVAIEKKEMENFKECIKNPYLKKI